MVTPDPADYLPLSSLEPWGLVAEAEELVRDNRLAGVVL